MWLLLAVAHLQSGNVNSEVVGDPVPALLVNHAAQDCGAQVMEASPHTKNKQAILQSDRDAYLLSPCSTHMSVGVELCQEILISQIQLANHELFSSMVHRINLFIQGRRPGVDWLFLDTIFANDTRVEQTFFIKDPIQFTKYLKLEAVSHHGSEFYCPLTTLRVFGVTMLEDFRSDKDTMQIADDAKDSVDLPPIARLASENQAEADAGGEERQPFVLTWWHFVTSAATNGWRSLRTSLASSQPVAERDQDQPLEHRDPRKEDNIHEVPLAPIHGANDHESDSTGTSTQSAGMPAHQPETLVEHGPEASVADSAAVKVVDVPQSTEVVPSGVVLIVAASASVEELPTVPSVGESASHSASLPIAAAAIGAADIHFESIDVVVFVPENIDNTAANEPLDLPPVTESVESVAVVIIFSRASSLQQDDAASFAWFANFFEGPPISLALCDSEEESVDNLTNARSENIGATMTMRITAGNETAMPSNSAPNMFGRDPSTKIASSSFADEATDGQVAVGIPSPDETAPTNAAGDSPASETVEVNDTGRPAAIIGAGGGTPPLLVSSGGEKGSVFKVLSTNIIELKTNLSTAWSALHGLGAHIDIINATAAAVRDSHERDLEHLKTLLGAHAVQLDRLDRDHAATMAEMLRLLQQLALDISAPHAPDHARGSLASDSSWWLWRARGEGLVATALLVFAVLATHRCRRRAQQRSVFRRASLGNPTMSSSGSSGSTSPDSDLEWAEFFATAESPPLSAAARRRSSPFISTPMESTVPAVLASQALQLTPSRDGRTQDRQTPAARSHLFSVIGAGTLSGTPTMSRRKAALIVAEAATAAGVHPLPTAWTTRSSHTREKKRANSCPPAIDVRANQTALSWYELDSAALRTSTPSVCCKS